MSSPLRVLIVDDEPAARLRLQTLCAADPALTVVGECRDGRQAIAAIREIAPDLVFLDVQMRGVNGFQVIEEVGASRMPFVVFATAFDQYALNAFDVNAVDYLLKPFDETRFAEAMIRVRERIGEGAGREMATRLARTLEAVMEDARRNAGLRPARVVVEKDERLVLLDPDDIDCIEAQRNYVLVHARQDFYLLRCSMKRVEEMLAPGRFLRIQRSVIVNTARIRELERWFHGEYKVTMQNGMEFTSGRTYREKVLSYVRNQSA